MVTLKFLSCLGWEDLASNQFVGKSNEHTRAKNGTVYIENRDLPAGRQALLFGFCAHSFINFL